MRGNIKTVARQLGTLAYEAWDSIDGDDNAMCVNILQLALNLLLAEDSHDIWRAHKMFEDSSEPYEQDETAAPTIARVRKVVNPPGFTASAA